MRAGVLCLTLLALVGRASAYEMYEGVYDEDNVISADYFRQILSFPNGDVSRRWNVANDGSLTVRDLEMMYAPKKDGARNPVASALIGYSTAERYEMTFEYQATEPLKVWMLFDHPTEWVEGTSQGLPGTDKSVRSPGEGTDKSVRSPNAEWTRVTMSAKRPAHVSTLSVQFLAPKKGGTLRVRNLVVRGVEPGDGTDKSVRSPLMLDDKVCEAIYWTRSDVRGNWFDRKAAQILRYSLAQAGGPLLPVREAKADADYAKCAVYVGKAGEKMGLVDPKRIAAFTEAGWAMAQKDGRLAIVGAYPSGQAFGVVEFLRRLGVRYYCYDDFTKPEAFASSAFEAAANPNMPRLYLCLHNVYHAELLGYQPAETHSHWKLGGSHTISYHQGTVFVPGTELLAAGHTNWLQMAQDGSRKLDPRGGTLYCFSEPDLDKLFVDRLTEFAKANPLMDTFSFQPGDGGDVTCCCPKCKPLRDVSCSDLFVTWVNGIAKAVERNVPGTKIRYGAYTDFEKPPKQVALAENVSAEYCPYFPDEWLSHYWWDCPGNAVGRDVLELWGKTHPRRFTMMTYPCNLEHGSYNATPAFWFNYRLLKNAAEHHCLGVEYCGWHLPYGHGVPGGAFGILSVDVMARVMKDPSVDVNAEIDRFMRDYYGPAATDMKAYFDLIEARPDAVRWIQNCEERRRGFFQDAAFADACFALLDAARAKVGATGCRRTRIDWEYGNLLQSWLEDNNRGLGNVRREDLPKYAGRLAEFCRTRRATGSYYIGTLVKKWFWDNHLLNIDKAWGWWKDDKTILALMADPVGTLGRSVPLSQKRETDGWSWDAKGMLGGEFSESNWMRQEAMAERCVRRPTSGFGQVRLSLRLDADLTGEATLVVHGIDNEKPGKALGEIVVNDKTIAKGPVPFAKDAWGDWTVALPKGLLVKGDNDIIIRNVTPDKEQDGLCGEAFFAVRNYWWGWFSIDRVAVKAAAAK